MLVECHLQKYSLESTHSAILKGGFAPSNSKLLHFSTPLLSVLNTQVSEGHHRMQAHQSKFASEIICFGLLHHTGILLQNIWQVVRQLTHSCQCTHIDRTQKIMEARELCCPHRAETDPDVDMEHDFPPVRTTGFPFRFILQKTGPLLTLKEFFFTNARYS